jgi:hypothetical protein
VTLGMESPEELLQREQEHMQRVLHAAHARIEKEKAMEKEHELRAQEMITECVAFHERLVLEKEQYEKEIEKKRYNTELSRQTRNLKKEEQDEADLAESRRLAEVRAQKTTMFEKQNAQNKNAATDRALKFARERAIKLERIKKLNAQKEANLRAVRLLLPRSPSAQKVFLWPPQWSVLACRLKCVCGCVRLRDQIADRTEQKMIQSEKMRTQSLEVSTPGWIFLCLCRFLPKRAMTEQQIRYLCEVLSDTSVAMGSPKTDQADDSCDAKRRQTTEGSAGVGQQSGADCLGKRGQKTQNGGTLGRGTLYVSCCWQHVSLSFEMSYHSLGVFRF